jgi:hypothetical protein
MARWVKLTAGTGPQAVFVNLDQAAWIRPAEPGATIGFARDEADTITVKESPEAVLDAPVLHHHAPPTIAVN